MDPGKKIDGNFSEEPIVPIFQDTELKTFVLIDLNLDQSTLKSLSLADML